MSIDGPTYCTLTRVDRTLAGYTLLREQSKAHDFWSTGYRRRKRVLYYTQVTYIMSIDCQVVYRHRQRLGTQRFGGRL